jgi:hypothetical protein
VVIILHIEAMSNSLLYTNSIFALLVLLSTIVQLFDDVMLFALVTTIPMTLVATTMIIDLM